MLPPPLQRLGLLLGCLVWGGFQVWALPDHAIQSELKGDSVKSLRQVYPVLDLPKELHPKEAFECGLVNGEHITIECLKPGVRPVSLWPEHLPQMIRQGEQTWPARFVEEDSPFARAFTQLEKSRTFSPSFWHQLPMNRRWLLIALFGGLAALFLLTHPPRKGLIGLAFLLALGLLPKYERALAVVKSEQLWRCSPTPSGLDVFYYQWPRGEGLYFSLGEPPNIEKLNLQKRIVLPKSHSELITQSSCATISSAWSELVIVRD